MSKAFWEYAEKRASNYFEGSLVTGSGRGFLKSDVTQTEVINGKKVVKQFGYRVEVKSTVNDTISFETNWLIKIIFEAKKYKQHPAFFVVFGDKSSFALTPAEFEEAPEEYIHINSKTKTINPDTFRKYSYLKLDPLILREAKVTMDCYYIWWAIAEDK